MIFIKPKASAVKAMTVKIPRYIESKFGTPYKADPPLYEGAGRIYTWLNIQSTAGLMLSVPGPRDKNATIMFTFMAFR